MKTILALAPLALALAACETYPSDPYGSQGYPETAPYPAPYPPQTPYPPQAPYPPQEPYPTTDATYRAIGTEPFWDLEIGRDMVFTDRGSNLAPVVQARPPVQRGTAGEMYNTPRINVNIVHSRCSDGMSDRGYPETVQVRVDGREYRGCGAPIAFFSQVGESGNWNTPPVVGNAPPLDRTRWRVVTINGRPVPRGDYHIDFETNRLNAKFGCNTIGAGYTQNGSTLDAGALLVTRMMCPDISWENQAIGVIDQVMTISMLDPNRMRLSSVAGAIEMVRR